MDNYESLSSAHESLKIILKTGGIILLVSSIFSCVITDDYRFLMIGIAIISGYLIPGYLLKKENF